MPAAASSLVLGLILAGAAALRFIGLGEQSYWYDEAVTVAVLDGSLGDVLGRLPDSESTPPLYYVVAWLWSQVAGIGEAGLRSLSAVAGLAIVPVAFLAARAVASATAGAVAAAVVAVNPMLVWYAQEARAYSLVALLAALSLLAVVRLDRPTPGRLALWSAASTLLLLTHYFGVFLVAGEALLLLLRLRDHRQSVALACAPWILAGLALVPLARAQEEDGRTSWIADEPLGERVADVARELGTANTALVSSNSAAPGGLWWILAVGALILAAAAIVRRRDDRAAGIALVGAGALLVPLVLALTPLDFFKDRNLIAAWPVLAVALGVAVAEAPRALVVAVTAGVAAAGAAVCIAVAGDADLQRADWRSAIDRIGPGDVPRAILVQPSYAHAPLTVYGLRLAAPAPGTGIEELVVLGTETRPESAAPAVGELAVVERGTKGGVGFVRYRAPDLQRLDAAAIGNAGPGLRYAPSESARRWTQRVASLAAGWERVLAEPDGSAGRDAPARLRALLPVPPELPDAAGLEDRLRAAADAVARYSGDRSPPARAALERALERLG